MTMIVKNILINAAISSDQNPETTLALAGEHLTTYEYERIREVMVNGTPITWPNIDNLF